VQWRRSVGPHLDPLVTTASFDQPCSLQYRSALTATRRPHLGCIHDRLSFTPNPNPRYKYPNSNPYLNATYPHLASYPYLTLTLNLTLTLTLTNTNPEDFIVVHETGEERGDPFDLWSNPNPNLTLTLNNSTLDYASYPHRDLMSSSNHNPIASSSNPDPTSNSEASLRIVI
jgi:hypothetical protein